LIERTGNETIIVGISGSPRAEGNTEMLLDAALEGARSEGAVTVKLRLNEMNIKPCQGCGGCSGTGLCVIADDMQQVYSLLQQMDGLVLASPIYFGGLTAQTKAMVDRCQALWARKHLLGDPLSADGVARRVLFLSAASASVRQQIEAVRTEVAAFLETFDGSSEELVFPSLEEAGQVAEDWTALTQAHAAGARLAIQGRVVNP
jgi:multimeric flavodoxin WrbA